MRSDPLKKGINAAPQRALLKALGLCDAEIERPLIGVVSSQNDIVPGHVFLDKITDAVKQGVALGGGVPIVFPAILSEIRQSYRKFLHRIQTPASLPRNWYKTKRKFRVGT